MNTPLTLNRYLWILALVASFTSGCSSTPVREHPDFANATRNIDKIVVLPPEITVTEMAFAGDGTRLTEDENKVRETLGWGVSGILREHGYTVIDFNQEKLQDTDKDASFTLEKIKSAYNQASSQLYEKGNVSEKESRKFRVSVGPVVNPVAEAMECDALLVVNYSGFKKSSGLMAKEVVSGALLGILTGAMPVPVREGGGMEIALLDTTTGDVLWANRGGGAFDALTMARMLLTKLPSGNKTIAVMPEKNTDIAH